MSTKQLYEKTSEGMKEVSPLVAIEDIYSKLSDTPLEALVSLYNHVKCEWKGSVADTRRTVPLFLRRSGLFITYNNGTKYITEFFSAGNDQINTENWIKDSNWTPVPDEDYISAGVKPGFGTIGYEQLSDNLKQLFREKVNVTNFPDDEDIASIDNMLKLKDREVDAANFQSKGYVILRKNLRLVNGVVKNILTQNMINKPNTNYEIRYDFDLNGETIKIPENTVLEFYGGSLCNGTLIGNNSIIQSSPITIFKHNLNIDGSWINNKTYCEWFNKDIQKTLLSFNSVNLVGNYIINKSIEISSYDKWYKIVFESGSNFSVDTSTPLDYCFIFKTYYHYHKLGSVEFANSFLNNVITGSGNIDLKGHCGFLKQIEYEGSNVDIYNINFNIYSINIRGIGKSINTTSEHLKEGTGITVNGSLTNVGIYTNRLATNKSNQYNIPYVAVKLLGGDNKLNRVTVVAPYIGIGSIAGDSVFNDVHVWGAPKIAFNVLGRSTFVNCYADYATIHYKINGWFPINIDKSIGISGNNDNINKQCILGFKDYNDLVHAKGNLSFSISGKSDNWNITGIVDEDIDEIKEVSNIIPSSLNVNNIDNLELINTSILTNEWTPICLLNRVFPICTLYLKPVDNNSIILYMYIDLARDLIYFFDMNISNSIFEEIKDLFKYDIIEINKTRYSRLWCRKKYIKITDCFAYLYKQQDIDVTNLNFTNLKPVNLHINYLSSIQEVNKEVEYNTTSAAYAESTPAWWNGKKWCNALGYTLAKVKGASGSRPTLTPDDVGFEFYDTNLKKKLLWNDSKWVNLDGSSLEIKKTGTTEQRPANVDIGFIYKDTTLNKLILWEGTKWVNLDGTSLTQ